MPRTTARVDGVLLVDKPAGVTSHDVVALARRSLGVRRIGHTGTLDPFATGLLVLLVGQATRLARFVEDEPKVYEATIEFGTETDTDDLTGGIMREAELPEPGAVDGAIATLTGPIQQVPPAFSAKKVAGKRAYAAARAGAPIELQPATVTVYGWDVHRRSAATLEVTITCSGGTYIRALARDLGRAAGSAAHLTALRRIRSGVFDLGGARAMSDLETGAASLASMRSAIPSLTSQLLDDAEVSRIRHGQAVPARGDALTAALVDSVGDLVAIGSRDGNRLRPIVVMQYDR